MIQFYIFTARKKEYEFVFFKSLLNALSVNDQLTGYLWSKILHKQK